MGFHIGKLYFGYRDHDSYRWKQYLIPKAYNSDRYFKHHYYKFYYRWLNFFWCMPRKCDQCGKYMDKYGGHYIYDGDDKVIMIVCHTCYHSKEYIDAQGRKYCGSIAWMEEQWDKENGKESRICQRYT